MCTQKFKVGCYLIYCALYLPFSLRLNSLPIYNKLSGMTLNMKSIAFINIAMIVSNLRLLYESDYYVVLCNLFLKYFASAYSTNYYKICHLIDRMLPFFSNRIGLLVQNDLNSFCNAHIIDQEHERN